mgnify:FL=1
MPKKNYYAVKVGHHPGIYKTWDECKKAVDGYSGSQFKGFATLEEAEEYMGSKAQQNLYTSKKKYYAVKAGRRPGIYKTWEECRAAVAGYSESRFKGFTTLEEAEEYMGYRNYPEENTEDTDPSVEPRLDDEDSHIPDIPPGKCIAYVDGSYNAATHVYGYGAILLPSKKRLSGHGNDPKMSAMRNVAGEIVSSMRAIYEAISAGYKEVEIRHDYEGIGKWGDGLWKTNKDETTQYKEYVANARKKIKISFVKVKAHSSDYWNKRVDALAKEAAGVN